MPKYKYGGHLYKNKGILLFITYSFQYLYFLDKTFQEYLSKPKMNMRKKACIVRN
jgi:hypothetical protein